MITKTFNTQGNFNDKNIYTYLCDFNSTGVTFTLQSLISDTDRLINGYALNPGSAVNATLTRIDLCCVGFTAQDTAFNDAVYYNLVITYNNTLLNLLGTSVNNVTGTTQNTALANTHNSTADSVGYANVQILSNSFVATFTPLGVYATSMANNMFFQLLNNSSTVFTPAAMRFQIQVTEHISFF
jgi:hypothetical protein